MLFCQLDITLDAGRTVWLRGPNGSGKTSLMRILAGLSAPTSGQVLVDGEPLCVTAVPARRRLTYLGHTNALKDDLTPWESLTYLAQLAALDRPRTRAAAALERVGFTAPRDGLVRTLSQGQRRRCAVARLALDAGDGIWLLDEPYDSLDADGALSLSALLGEHTSRGGAVLLTSHQPVALEGVSQFHLGQRMCT